MRKVPQIAAATAIRSGHLGVSRRFAKGAAVILLASLVVMAPTIATAKNSAANRSGDPAVISEWNQIAQQTLVADTTKAHVEDILYMGFVQAAVYNAVVGIEGRYEPYHFKARAHHRASSQAAAVAAAHKILVTYSPAAKADLDAKYAAARGFVDAVITPEDTRDAIELSLRTTLNYDGPHIGQFVLPPSLV